VFFIGFSITKFIFFRREMSEVILNLVAKEKNFLQLTLEDRLCGLVVTVDEDPVPLDLAEESPKMFVLFG
jgi:hypothetical protein